MKQNTSISAILTALIAVVACQAAQAQTSFTPATSAAESVSPGSIQSKIAVALSAAPPDIAKDATVAEMDSHGTMKILRAGTNAFTCLPGDPHGVGMPPMCEDKVAMQWNEDRREHKPAPTTTVPGIEYMLAGATQRSDSDPNDKTSPPIDIGPHWMILWPFDPATSGLPAVHKSTGAYIMYAGTPWAHLHVMGTP